MAGSGIGGSVLGVGPGHTAELFRGSWRAVLRQGGETAAMQRSGAVEQHGGGALGFTGGGGEGEGYGRGWGPFL